MGSELKSLHDIVIEADKDMLEYYLRRAVTLATNDYLIALHKECGIMRELFAETACIRDIEFSLDAYRPDDSYILIKPVTGTSFKDVCTHVCAVLEDKGYDIVSSQDVGGWPARRQFTLSVSGGRPDIVIAISVGGTTACRVEKVTTPIPEKDRITERIISYKIVCDEPVPVTPPYMDNPTHE